MIISTNWLKQFTPIDRSIDELVTLIGSRLVEIEGVTDLSKKYKGVVIAKVLSVTNHPNADRLHVCVIDDGGVTEGVQRDENGHVQVVCGAPNVREGISVAWLPPGSTVPDSYDKDSFVLEARELRGVISNGMLASAKELSIGDEHDGIVEIDKEAAPGDSFAEVYELNDYLLDIENKSLTHRPDCFGLIGFAREVAAIQGNEFKTPDWLQALEPVLGEVVAQDNVHAPSVRIENADICARYQAVVIANIDATKQSPLQVKSYLARVGMRPISAIVDTTNYLMLLTGQPLHAFDYDKFVKTSSTGAADITVRVGHENEKLALLDGREITLTDGDIVICAGDTPVSLAGAMGGNSTEIDGTTKTILLESATFDLYRLRNTQMRHGIYSEAITRFTKGQPAPQTAPVLASAVRMFCDIAGGVRATEVVDEYPGRVDTQPIDLTITQVNNVLGADFSLEQVGEILTRIEIGHTSNDQSPMSVKPPFWRADLHIAEDLIEEVGRISGYDEIKPTLPTRNLTATSPRDFDLLRAKVRNILAAGGANEVLTYSFVPEKLLQIVGQVSDNSFKIVNAISHDLQFTRQSLVPSLLDKVHANVRAGYDEFALFELNKTSSKSYSDETDDNLPTEFDLLALVRVNNKPKVDSGAAFYDSRAMLDFLANKFGVEFEYKVLESETDVASMKPFDYTRSAAIFVANKQVSIGITGEFKASVIKKLKLPIRSSGFEIDLKKLAASSPNTKAYHASSRYPGTERDVCLRVGNDVSYAALRALIASELKKTELLTELSPVDIYKSDEHHDKVQMTFRLKLTDMKKTITAEQANAVVAQIATIAQHAYSAEMI